METVVPSASDGLGVPNPSNAFLPDFDSYGRAFFEHQGLRFRVGPVHFRFELGASTEYNDNIFGSYTDATADIIARVTPVLRVGVGDFQQGNEDFAKLEYQPSYDEFFQNPGQSYLNQSLNASGKATFSRYSTNFALNYLQSNQPTATETGRQGYGYLNFTWNNVYYLGAKTFASAAVTVSNQNYETTGQNYTTYSLAPQLGYAYSPKTTVFMGPYAGIAYLGDGATQTFQGVTVGMSYDTLRKLSFEGSVGIQARQFQGLETSGSTNFTTPIFNLGATWKPTDGSSVQIGLSRTVEISNLGEGTTYTNTTFGGGWEQRLTDHFSFRLTASYQYLDYGQNKVLYPDGRADQYIVINPALSYHFWRDQAAIDLYYQRQQRTSDIETFGFTVNIYGIRLVYKF